MQTVAPTFTPTPDFLQLDRIPGLDPLTFAGQEEATTGETYSLPEDIFSAARERQLAPIEADGVASRCVNNSCTVMLTDVLVSGAKLQPATDGKVPYGFDGEIGSEALFRFDGLPEGVRATAFVAQEGNPWGLLPGTVVVWFWQGGSKGPTQILNLDNPLRIMADKPNSIQITSADNGFIVTTTDAGGAVIDEQRVAFLPPLPSEFLAKYPNGGYEIVDGKVMVNGEVWFEINSAGEWRETNAKLLADAVAEGYKPLDLEQFPVIKDFLVYMDTVCASSNRVLGDVAEFKLLEKAAGLPEGKLWEPDFFDYYIIKTNSFRCSVLLISSEPELIKFWSDGQWGRWQGIVKIFFLTSLDGEAEKFIYFPEPQE